MTKEDIKSLTDKEFDNLIEKKIERTEFIMTEIMIFIVLAYEAREIKI